MENENEKVKVLGRSIGSQSLFSIKQYFYCLFLGEVARQRWYTILENWITNNTREDYGEWNERHHAKDTREYVTQICKIFKVGNWLTYRLNEGEKWNARVKKKMQSGWNVGSHLCENKRWIYWIVCSYHDLQVISVNHNQLKKNPKT